MKIRMFWLLVELWLFVRWVKLFFHIEDSQGRIQVYIKKDEVGESQYEVFKLLDIGFYWCKWICF